MSGHVESGPSIHHRPVRRSSLALVLVLVAALIAGGCSGSDEKDESRPAENTTTTAPALTLPRYRTEGIRLAVSNTEPLVIYNVYPSGAEPELIEQVVDLWPEDLLPYLAIQIIPNGFDELTLPERAEAVDVMLDAADKAQVAVILQTFTLFGDEGPGEAAVDAAFDEHPSLVGIGVAELSAKYET